MTRRCYYLVPAQGEPRKLVNRLEPAMLDALPGKTAAYTTWQEHRSAVEALVAAPRLAAQYSSFKSDPHRVATRRRDRRSAARRRHRADSSAELVQRFAATWTGCACAGYRRACTALHELVHEAFRMVGEKLRSGGSIDEYAVQRFLLEGFERRGIWAESAPIVGVNAHSADPHYQPKSDSSSPIRKGTSCSSTCGPRSAHRRASTPTSPGYTAAPRRPSASARCSRRWYAAATPRSN